MKASPVIRNRDPRDLQPDIFPGPELELNNMEFFMDRNKTGRRQLLKAAGAGAASLILGSSSRNRMAGQDRPKRPNLVFVFADQWRAEAAGYAGNQVVRTPNLDRLAGESFNFRTAVSGCPVCCPYRASLLTGQYPLTHGVFLNDAPLGNNAESIAQVYNEAGYDTGYIGKWHLDGGIKPGFVPPGERRLGFDHFVGFNRGHFYFNSIYYRDTDQPYHCRRYEPDDRHSARFRLVQR